jgi:hypothetical protein
MDMLHARFVGILIAGLTLTGLHLGAADRQAFEGKPSFKEGRDLGYYVWTDGDTWHVRWTTMGAKRRFTGTVTADGGDLKSLKRIDVETERKVIRPGRAPHVVRGPRGRARGVAGGRPAVVATREQDHIEMDGDRRIRFNAQTDDDIDGYDFKVTRDVRTLRFVLEIDGASKPTDVEGGRTNHHPAQNPFVVQLK